MKPVHDQSRPGTQGKHRTCKDCPEDAQGRMQSRLMSANQQDLCREQGEPAAERRPVKIDDGRIGRRAVVAPHDLRREATDDCRPYDRNDEQEKVAIALCGAMASCRSRGKFQTRFGRNSFWPIPFLQRL